ncbi:coiled-coil domain-containing protein AGAP005037-like isoform X5 [Dermacentor andersoni]|uniref:coiled-coil domain-containing protein AGAP005037-like isoform X5 n=1 Tax=Dermacentor andersoni TaxID=34620 RepID=UPI0024170173|nr:coiled-coil domain-containing protein AGAP005037-like isoform X5 [Dermacentor andersoni]
MPFSIRRLTLQRSLSGGERPKSEPPGGRAAIKKSASQDEARAARALPSSRSADQGDLRRLQALGQAPSPVQGSPLQHHEPAQPQQQPPEPPARNWSPQLTSGGGGRYPTRAVSVDRATSSSSSSLLSRWRQVGRSKSASISEPREYPLDDGNAKPTPPPRPPRSAASRLSAAGGKGPADWSGGGGGGVVAGHTVRRPVPRRQHSLPETQEQQLQRSIMELQSHLGAPVGGGGGGGGRMVGPPMYQPPASVYDEDPGIMSEVETSATGLRRATKARASLPVVRTPSKTQERPLARMTLVKPGELGDWQDGKGNRYKEDYRTSMSPSGGVYVNNELASRAAMMTSLGLVFLQYRSETKRALLPNEITSIDTVKALFVRSFPKQLTMEYLDSPHIRIYIHDPSKDMFYELEDLRDIRDRSVIRIYEQDVNDGGVYSTYDQDMSYFSEPEFDSEYQNQHIHRAKGGKSQGAGYYGVPAYPPQGRTQTLPHGATIRPFSPAPQERPKPSPGYSQTLPRGMTYSSVALSPEKRQPGLLVTAAGPLGAAPAKPQRFYGQPPPPLRVASPLTSPRSPLPRPVPPPPRALSPDRGGSGLLAEAGYPPVVGAPFPAAGAPPGPYPPPTSPRRYDLAGYPPADDRGRGGDPGYSPEHRLDHTRSLPATFNSAYEEPFYGGDAAAAYGSRSGSATPIIDEEARMRVEYMERQLASLTGLVHKALAAGTSPRQPSHLIPTRDTDVAPEKDRSEEKSVSFSDETLDCHKQRQHSPQPAEKPTKPAIKGLRSHSISDDYSGVTSAIPDKDGRPSKPAPPPKPASLSCALESRQHSSSPAKEIHFNAEACSQLQLLRKQTKDLRLEVRNLRRMTQSQAVTAREMIRETCLKIKVMLAAVQVGEDQVCAERLRVSREEDLYRQDVTRLEKDLSDLESQVEELRGNVINRRCRVNMSNVESMALVLSRASKTVADLKARFPNLQESLKSVMGAEMEVVVREEKFLKEEPERLENALRRCKKLTGTLVTLKRLASVQEQRHTGAHSLPEKAASADGPYSDGEAHTARSSRQAWKWSSNFREKIDLWRGYSTLGWSDKTCDAAGEPAGGAASDSSKGSPAARSENALDALLDELQTFSKPADKRGGGRPHSADSPVRASSSASVGSGKPPSGATVIVVDGPGGGVSKKTPPPPPPRTTSKSPVTSPTGPQRSRSEPVRTNALAAEDASSSSSGSSGGRRDQLSSNSSSSESVNSQEGLQARSRQELLDSRHQELLRKQRQLQEQYARLQLLQRLSPPKPDLKKTGSESNILHKASLSLGSAGGASGSLTHLAVPSSALRTGAKIYETDIL